MPTVKSKPSLLTKFSGTTSAAAYHLGRWGELYFFGSLVTAAAVGLPALMISESNQDEKQRQVIFDTESRQLTEAFNSGQTKITFADGDTCGILSNVDVNGDTFVSAHPVVRLLPNGDIAEVSPNPRLRTRLAAP
jgi:hypothetical protein